MKNKLELRIDSTGWLHVRVLRKVKSTFSLGLSSSKGAEKLIRYPSAELAIELIFLFKKQ